MKKSLFVIVLVTLALLLVACGGGGNSVVGKWESVYMSQGDVNIKAVGVVKIELKEDNTAIGQSLAEGPDVEGTWKKDGDKIIITLAGETSEAALENGMLVVSYMEDAKMYFSKDAAKFDKFPEGIIDPEAGE